MVDDCIDKLCAVCGRKVGGAGYYCAVCKICVCFPCWTRQIMDCHDVQTLKRGPLPFCPKCGGKLD